MATSFDIAESGWYTASSMTVWSVGHSNRGLDDFVALLRGHGIDVVADIRRVPKSRRHPHFHIDELRRSLPDLAIDYVHVPQLAGFRERRENSPNDAWRNESFRAYADYAMSDEFAAGLAKLRGLAGKARTAMMCSEALWWRCHRRLVADRLVAGGDTVLHIGSATRASAHEISSFAVVTQDGQIIYPDDTQRSLR